MDEVNLYVDHTSGTKSSRPQWDLVCRVLRPGDVLVATCLDRVGRSTTHLVSLLDEFHQREVSFRFLEQGIDTTTAEGCMVYRMLAAVAEFQRDLIVANTHEGLAAARTRGRKGGQRPKLHRAPSRTRPAALRRPRENRPTDRRPIHRAPQHDLRLPQPERPVTPALPCGWP